MKHTLLVLAMSTILFSCGENADKQKEAVLKEKELALKQKELELKEKEIAGADSLKAKPVNNPPDVINETKFPDIQSFFAFFKKAVSENDLQKLSSCTDLGNYKDRNDFIKNFSFSARVKKIIQNTTLPEYWKENKYYGIQGNDGEEGSAMFFSLIFQKNKNGTWTWSMSYAS